MQTQLRPGSDWTGKAQVALHKPGTRVDEILLEIAGTIIKYFRFISD